MDPVELSLNVSNAGLGQVYLPREILANMSLAFILGLAISSIYKTTHRGISYSQSFMLTMVFVTLIVAMVMMVIGNSLTRAFALVGALSIIRFRTVVKDTKDTTFVFMALAAGMASGTGNYYLAVIGTVVFSAIALVLHKTNFGSYYKSELILRFRSAASAEKSDYNKIINDNSKSATLIHLEVSNDKKSFLSTFDIVLKKNVDADDFAAQLGASPDVSEVRLIASKSDVDF